MNERNDPPTSVLDERIRASTRPMLVDFTADWCPPCRAISPILDDIAAERVDAVDIVRLDVDEHPDTASRHRVRSLPTLVLFVEGTDVSRLVGAHPKRSIDQWLDQGLDSAASARSRAS